jgi:arsenite methyltransferase
MSEHSGTAVLSPTAVRTKSNQFVLPHGLAGRLAGRLMAAVNADMERAAIRNLHLEGNERVLEIGFGPGVGVRHAIRRLPWGFVAGVDPSAVMVRQASRRVRRYMRSGLVDLRLGDASELPWPDGRFDAVVSVNNVMLWEPLDDALAEVRRVLKPDGRMSIAVHEWAAQEGRDLAADVEAALWLGGFTGVTCRRRMALSGHALYLKARAH